MDDFLALIENEVKVAQENFSPMASHHEAYAIIKEELEEYWQSVKEDNPSYRELIQVAAMALRTLIDLEFRGRNEKRL